MSPVRETSAEAHRDMASSGKMCDRQREVMNALAIINSSVALDATDSEIARALGHSDPNYVRPRRFELVEKGLVVASRKRRCLVTGRTCIAWSVGRGTFDLEDKKGIYPLGVEK